MAERIDWLYSRRGCRSSAQLRRFLEGRGCVVAEEADADAAPLDADAAVALVRSVSKLVVAWRGEVRMWELAGGKYFKFLLFKPGRDRRANGFDAPGGAEPDGTLRYSILNLSGSLRTPAMRKGNTLLVGFSEAAAGRVFRRS